MTLESWLLMFLLFTWRYPMALKINTARTFDASVTVHFHDDNGQPAKGTFGATFKVVPTDSLKDSEDSFLDHVLVSVNESELELIGEDGQRLTGEALLSAVKVDPSISLAIVTAYNEQVAKKNLKRT